MSLQQKIENEMAILKGLIARYKSTKDPESIYVVVAYEYALQVLSEVYEVSKQEKRIPF
ncbi:hypothetical protein IGM_04366 [Bacillus cereus HuB4-4]|uniref:Uncharacterized protein n=1 Tax=Bacillus cereus HuB4-4 TaxID=1053211 RepID=A0A9W5QSH3_BACCE|nr:hypothetical protein [Bacillus cereus]EOP85991.1 hypothetical protein IGM_04366 [Bacillus cereus HuB4-4]